MTDDKIKSVFLAHGFTIKPGCDDLKPYVYEAARALLASHAVKPLSECTPEDLVNQHAFVYGRCKVRPQFFSDAREMEFYWSKMAWWKAMWYPHHGKPECSGSWGVYGGNGGFTGPGDAELTHFMRIPDAPLV